MVATETIYIPFQTMNHPAKIYIHPRASFIIKYIHRELSDNPVTPRQKITEDIETTDSDFTIVTFDDHIIVKSIDGRTVTLKLPMVIGTGMTGEGARMARMIYRGTYFHVKDSTSRVSVIHATDAAKAVRLAMTSDALEGEYAISDFNEPSRHDLAEAIAYRLGQKRIYSLTMKRFASIARWADKLGIAPFSSKRLKMLTSEALIDTSRWNEATADSWHPTPVIEYLRTHDYDHNSL